MEFALLRRERLFLIISCIFLGLAVAASFIGWSTSNTINHAYDLSRPFLPQGIHMPANPFSHVSHLSLQRNLSIYFFLIGSLLAIVIGYTATIRDRTSRVAMLTMTRPLSRLNYVSAKAVAVATVLALLLVISYALTLLLCALFPELHLSALQIGKLGLFYGLSWIYLLSFGLLGLLSGLLARSQMLALVIPVTVWIMIGFVLPQAISGLEPTALLNPVSITSSGQLPSIFTSLQAIFTPISFAQNYKVAAGSLLEFGPPLANGAVIVGSIFGAAVVTTLATIGAARLYRPAEEIV